MEVHRILGLGLLEIVYKDALEIEFKNHNIPYEREKEYSVEYKGIILPHKFTPTLLCIPILF
ncbi:GxxExxY protein [Flavobacterium xueshanense]|uniref:GxxExxY protein n=1 Tax=Flavobacterium xueshanense TaxID=935223 RepID=A0A1I1YVB2_9FLAO|nr:GxxExxY protein [Flavobacterium xueshanense]